MVKELIRVNGGRITWSDAVARIADALNPLGSAARIVANIGACVVEINQFRIATMRLARQHAVATELIRTRQATIVQIFDIERLRSVQTKVDLSRLLDGYEKMVDLACNLHNSEEDRSLAMGIVPVLSGQVVHANISNGDQLIRLSDSLRLGDTDAAITAWRLLES
jgi:hypothetical protein